jgi:hypothetical protein
MIELIPKEKLKIHPWPRREKFLVHQKTGKKIVVMGFKEYMRKIKKKGKPKPAENPARP